MTVATLLLLSWPTPERYESPPFLAYLRIAEIDSPGTDEDQQKDYTEKLSHSAHDVGAAILAVVPLVARLD
jgi:hypothetical protein